MALLLRPTAGSGASQASNIKVMLLSHDKCGCGELSQLSNHELQWQEHGRGAAEIPMSFLLL